jgi:hypothetical protein
LPQLTLAHVYDALSYFHDYRDDIEQELWENTKEHGRAYLREHLGKAGYLPVTQIETDTALGTPRQCSSPSTASD